MIPNHRQSRVWNAVQDALWLAAINTYCYVRHPYLTAFASRWREGMPAPACPKHPVDKFLWRKVFDHDPSMIAMSDKISAKQIAADRCQDLKIPKILWVGDRFEDIPPDLISGDAVVKSTHGSGYFHVIRDGTYDRDELISETRRWMRTDYSQRRGEWNYGGIERKLFVEEFLKDDTGRPLPGDCKVYVFGRKALFMFYFHDRLTEHGRQSLYDRAGNSYEFKPYRHYPLSLEPPPPSVPALFAMAEKLVNGRDHVRVDLYDCGGSIYFSEFTFFNLAGKFNPDLVRHFPEIERLWDLGGTWFLNQAHAGWRGAYARWLKSRLDRQSTQSDA